MRSAGDIPKDRYYSGAIALDASVPKSANCPDSAGKPGTCLTRGFTPSGETISVGPRLDFSGNQQEYMSHEIGHALGRGHPFSSGPAFPRPGQPGSSWCSGQTGDDGDFPNPLGQIGNSFTTDRDETADLGFDPGQVGNAMQPRQLFAASTTYDFMSYCPPFWISSYTYGGLWAKLTFFPLAASLPRAAGAPVAAAIPGDWLLAFGSFSVDSQTGSFVSVRRLDAVADVPALLPGGYALELRDGAGGLLASHEFTPTPTDEASPDQRSFGLVVDFAPGTRSLRIVETSTAKVVATRLVSQSPPVVSDVALVGAPSPVTGIVDLTWAASDADGDALQYDVFYSHDGGASWRPLRLALSDTTVSLDTVALGGGTGVLRVEANDGAQSGRGDSAPFTVAQKPPAVRIQSPAGELHVQWGQLVNFVGEASDPQEQPIPEADFVWSNSYRKLGTGRAITVTDLEVGGYDVTLSVKSAAGLTATATVPVVVGDRIPLPGPRLSATPSPLSWMVAADSVAVQSATLQVVNVGGLGSLPFTATGTPDWIHVNGAATADSNAPVALAVTADPSGLPAGQTSSGQIVLTHTGETEDTITIPVTLAKGSVFLGVPPADSDADGVPDTRDDCLVVSNADQLDADGDGYGNACDPDLNNDGIVNFGDLALMKKVFFKTDAVADLNGDGVVNFADLAILKKSFFKKPGPAAGKP